MSNLRQAGATAIAPMFWGTTYLVTTELLPPGRPLLAGVLRALPAGLLLLAVVAAVTRTGDTGGGEGGAGVLPRGAWWWRAAVLGTLNIGVFFALLFVAAYRLPGGVAAVLGAVGPFVVAGLAYLLLGQRSGARVMVAGAAGLAGVALLVLRSASALDPVGLAAAAGGTLVMSLGTVLGRRWGTPAGYGSRRTALLALTGWQLTVGGVVLLPVAVLAEGVPSTLTWANVAGFGYLSLAGTALAYLLWFGGVTTLAPTGVTVLALLSPLTATMLGWLALDQSLSGGQIAGAAAVLGAVLLGATAPAPGSRRPAGHTGAGPHEGPGRTGAGLPDRPAYAGAGRAACTV